MPSDSFSFEKKFFAKMGNFFEERSSKDNVKRRKRENK